MIELFGKKFKIDCFRLLNNKLMSNQSTNPNIADSSDSAENDAVDTIDSFDDMNLPIALLRGIYAYGFERPSVIQQQAIVALIKGRDLIAQAQSGTGKTGAFAIGTLARIRQPKTPEVTSASISKPSSESMSKSSSERTSESSSEFKPKSSVSVVASTSDPDFKLKPVGLAVASSVSVTGIAQPQVLIISPTRELSEQTYNVIKSISQKMSVQTVLCIGGTSVNQDIRQLRQGADIIIGTPGRIYDLISRRALKTNNIQIMVLDEADEMLSQGFKDQIYEIYIELPETVQSVLFSATLPLEVQELTRQFMRNPLKILVKKEELTLEGIRQFHISVDPEDQKLEILIDLWNTLSMTQTIIYVNTKRKCQWLTHRLRDQGYAAAEIHSNLSPAERKDIMTDFKSGGTRILITTDLLARGIDIQQVALIVNYDVPQNIETYLHRIGRSGRFGRKGLAINLVGPHDDQKLVDICQYYATEIPVMPNNIKRFIG